MRLFIGVVLWCLLVAVCWPLAIVVVVVFPVVWVVALPFRVVGVVVECMLATLRALLMLPARVSSLGRGVRA